VLAAGCFRTQQEPLDDEHISLPLRGELFQASIAKPATHRLVEIEDAAVAKKLLASLMPIKSVRKGGLPRSADWTFLYQCGREPHLFKVVVSGEELVFEDHGYLYEGGKADEFVGVAEDLWKKP
jgi:hypothetical protein